MLVPACMAAILAAGGPHVGPGAAADTSLTVAGRPYWQQRVRYRTEARLDEDAGRLRGAELVHYRNASPDTLRRLYFHLYLNAFRPNSDWARAEERPEYDFQSLREPDYGYERLTEARLVESGDGSGDGEELVPSYPGAPDSTVVRFDLPAPLLPGDSLSVRLTWDARPATLCRRQCRRGRQWDFAQWYPKVAVYDRFGWEDHPLYPQGEFYGEFATYDVTLDLASDQVVGATGVPISGDPGWRPTPGSPESEVDYERDWYADTSRAGVSLGLARAESGPSPGLLTDPVSDGRKRVRFLAERVHHFAWSTSPSYRYEQLHYRPDLVLRVLYRPGDEEGWGGGAVLARMRAALQFLQSTFGRYPYPNYTILHRLEGGGTEFPMLTMNGGFSMGLVMHETSHQYAMGLLANNEWKEGWMDEGFATWLEAEFFRQAERSGLARRTRGPGGPFGYRRLGVHMTSEQAQDAGLLRLDLMGLSQPVSFVSEDYPDFDTYGRMIYSKGAKVYDLLRYVVGDSVFADFLHEYYRRWRFHHVSEAAFRQTAEEVSGRDLNPFFAEWLHGVGTTDYALGDVHTRRAGAGWRSRIEVERRGENVMPVEVALVRGADTVTVRADGRALRESVEATTPWKPERVVLDPHDRIMDTDRTNDAAGPLGVLPRLRLTPDWPLLSQSSRERYLLRWRPELWYDDVDHLRFGMRLTGALESWRRHLELGLWWGADSRQLDFLAGYSGMLQLLGRAEGSASLQRTEGRTRVRAGLAWDPARRLSDLGRTELGITGDVLYAFDPAYLRPGRWTTSSPASSGRGRSGTGDVELWARRRVPLAGGQLRLRLGWANGVATREIVGARVTEPTSGSPQGATRTTSLFEYAGYGRPSLEATWEGTAGSGLALRGRVYGEGVYSYASDAVLPIQRSVFAAGAGPYGVLSNPFVRSRGALFVRDADVRYHAPGGGNLRGYNENLATEALFSANLEVARGFRVRKWPVRAVEFAGFLDMGWVSGDGSSGVPGIVLGDDVLADAGPGVRLRGPLDLRLDFPLWVSRPELAVGPNREHAVDFRWVFSFERVF